MVEQFVPIVRTVKALRLYINTWRSSGDKVALVPTMGALHGGHLQLVREAKTSSNRVCVTLFVNPIQFTASSDLESYPKDEERDRALLMEEGVDLLYAPEFEEMYPQGEITRVSVIPMGKCLEGLYRPNFFTGVATVVSKLLIQSSPNIAVFGEKDFQQLQIIRRMVKDLCLPVEVKSVHTVRDRDGLALSSRNTHLTADEREVAPGLYRALNAICNHIRAGGCSSEIVEKETNKLLKIGFSSVDYLSLRDAVTLEEAETSTELNGSAGRILGAATLGKTRLIDNIPF